MTEPKSPDEAKRPSIEVEPDPADIRHAAAVERALKLQQGSVLAGEVMRLRGGQCTALCSDMEQDRDALLAERDALRAELETLRSVQQRALTFMTIHDGDRAEERSALIELRASLERHEKAMVRR